MIVLVVHEGINNTSQFFSSFPVWVGLLDLWKPYICEQRWVGINISKQKNSCGASLFLPTCPVLFFCRDVYYFLSLKSHWLWTPGLVSDPMIIILGFTTPSETVLFPFLFWWDYFTTHFSLCVVIYVFTPIRSINWDPLGPVCSLRKKQISFLTQSWKKTG